ncbi:MAG: adenylate/guanylate cyclase domain-containing protein [Actinomycetota bacterium]
MEAPETRYAESGGLHIAYQALGESAPDLVYVAEFWNSIEAQWEEPGFERFLRRLASFSRLICFDQRGSGMSDPVALEKLPTLEEWMDDVRAVMDAVGSRKAVLLGSGGGGLMSMLFAATYPERTEALILINSFARLTRAPDYPIGTSPEFEDRIVWELKNGWGRGILLETTAPTLASDASFRRWWARYQRLGASPGTVLTMRGMLQQSDVRHVLDSIRVPTLILHRAGNRLVDVALGRFLAEQIPGARYVEVQGVDYFPFVGDADAILDEVEEFVTGERASTQGDRVLATVLFTDIVGSTQRAAELGDRRWRDLLQRHHATIRRELQRHRGEEVDTAGDGFLATFDGPARAVRCAQAIGDAVHSLDLEVRCGLHTGEVERTAGKVGGLAVHIAARVMAGARPGEVLVSSTVKDLVGGSGLSFEDRGIHVLKGVPGEWRLFAVAL